MNKLHDSIRIHSLLTKLYENTDTNNALQKLTKEHGVKLRAYSDELLKAIGNRASEVLPEIASKSSDAKALYNEIVTIRESMLDWSTYAEAAYLEARKAAKMKTI